MSKTTRFPVPLAAGSALGVGSDVPAEDGLGVGVIAPCLASWSSVEGAETVGLVTRVAASERPWLLAAAVPPDGRMPTPPSTATSVTTTDDATAPIRPQRGRTELRRARADISAALQQCGG